MPIPPLPRPIGTTAGAAGGLAGGGVASARETPYALLPRDGMGLGARLRRHAVRLGLRLRLELRPRLGLRFGHLLDRARRQNGLDKGEHLAREGRRIAEP